MQTSLQRRARHRRNGAARRGRGGAARPIALAIPLFLFSSFLILGAIGFVAAVSAYAYYSNGLPDPQQAFQDIKLDSPTVVYDRTGTIELARLGEHKREIITYDQLPPEMIDATTAIEDKDFWTNPGFDLGGFISATIDTLAGRPRGGSTITQQLVRAQLLPDSAFTGSVYDRKIKEIIQSVRLTQELPQGQAGKQAIITAYLNQNFYGNQSYGVQAAAQSYFGKDVKDLTLAQAALLAAIPQSPTQYDLVRNAVSQCTITVTADQSCPAADTQLVVPQTAEVVQRRNRILDLMKTRSVLSGVNHTPADYDAAKNEPVVLVSQAPPPWKAPHFIWQVREQLGALLCGVESKDACQAVDTGGYTVITTLDWKIQQTTEKWLYVAGRAAQAKTVAATEQILKDAGIPRADWSSLLAYRGKNINNSAGIVLDYRTGQILGYGGSSGYYLPATKRFQPQYDVLSDGFRQMGSAVKPVNYVTAIDDHAITAATPFMDVVTDFGRGYTPTDFEPMERGPVRARSALQFSLNIPAIKLSFIQGLNHLYQRTLDFGFVYPPSITGPVASMAIGTLEMHAADLTSAFGAIADGGVLMPRTTILQVKDNQGKVIYPTAADKPVGKALVSPQAAYIVTDILAGNTIKSVNAYWAKWAVYDGNTRRPATVKTGTTEDNKDMTAFGYVAPPAGPNAPAIVVGVWLGNSDSSLMTKGFTSLAGSEALWSHLIRDVTKGTPIANFKQPSGIVSAAVDAYSGQLPGPYTVKTVNELFISGTQPTEKDTLHVATEIDSATGKLWQDGCTGPMVQQGFLDFSNMEPQFPQWQPFTQAWAQRAAKGPGVAGGPRHTTTQYFYDGRLVPFGRTWGGKFAPTEVCSAVTPTCGPGGGGGGGGPFSTPGPCETPGPTGPPTPSPSHGKPSPTPSPLLQPPAVAPP
ncbi:MAG TPA: transglycosylase domain-containing protein [Candidatus Limnocylindrales bacterium]|nr:transglycosylase domain-containing protein [Candidatus Limnocylindrales bacterium]